MPNPYSINVTDYYSGQDNDYTSAFRAALQAGRNIIIPPGIYFISDTIAVPANTQITGAGKGNTIIKVPENIQGINVFSIQFVSNIRISCLSITKEWSKPYDPHLVKKGVTGIHIGGNSKDIYVEHVTTDGCFYGFEIFNTLLMETAVFPEDMAVITSYPHVPPTHELDQGVLIPPFPISNSMDDYYASYNSAFIARRIIFAHCRATISASFVPAPYNGQFGFHLNDCNDVLLLNCHAERQYLDGAKVRKNTRNVSIIGGSFRYNGRAKLSTKYVGDGLDAFAGGDTLTINGAVFEYNTGNGILIKTGYLNSRKNILPNGTSFQHYFGDIGSVQITGVKCCYNTGWGMVFHRDRNAPDEFKELITKGDIPYPIGLSVTGGVFSHNNEAGMLIGSGEHISITGSLIGNNKGYIDVNHCIGLQIGAMENNSNPADADEEEINHVHPRNVIIQGVHIFSRENVYPDTQLTAIKIIAANNLLLEGCTINGNTDYPNNSAPQNERTIYCPILQLGHVIHFEQQHVYITNSVTQNS